MNITFNPSFQSRNKSIRKADDIQRNARNAFPCASPSYIDTFYRTNKSNDQIKRAQADKVIRRTDKKISAIREMIQESSFDGVTMEEKQLNAPIFQALRGMQILKTANCHECAALTLAALSANGIYDAQRVDLELKVMYVNPKTNKTEYKATIPLDHTTVIAQIGSNKKKDKVVVDSWLGFADSLSGASEKYKQSMIVGKPKDDLRMHRSLFRLEKFEKDGILINPDTDYELKTSIKYKIKEDVPIENMKVIGYYTRCCFPELIKK